VIYIYNFATAPTNEYECREATWSEGKSCKKCQSDCYRKGWNKAMVTDDNFKLCQQK